MRVSVGTAMQAGQANGWWARWNKALIGMAVELSWWRAKMTKGLSGSGLRH